MPEVLGVETPTVQSAIVARLTTGQAPSWISAERWKLVKALYSSYDDAPLWLEPGGVKERASALLAALEAAPDHALRADAYPIDSVRRVTTRIDSGATPQAMADADVLLTAAYVGYASDMLVGQVNPQTLAQSWHIPARMSAVDSALVHTLQDSSIAEGLAAMAPPDSDYALLKREYIHYRQLVDSGGWRPLGPTAGAHDIGARLAAEGYTIAGDDSVASALALWQIRHNLDADGRMGPATRAALNVPAAERMRQIASNMERHRWLPRALGNRYVYVNVPAFRLDAFDSGQRVLTMKVVVGSEYNGHSTPVFSDSMRYVVYRPYWKPTPNIVKNEIRPHMAADRAYLARNDMEVATEGGAQVIRQRPGPHNALGLVKFLFPNDYDIYLHDTNQKSLFGRAERAASHGCIRLEHPEQLAQFALGWPPDSVQAAMQSGRNDNWVALRQKIPVYIVYFTAFARDGALYFANDVYRRDGAMNRRLD